MPTASQITIDPLHVFMAGAFVAGTSRPCPLAATRFDIAIEAGLAVVAMSRAFRNAEESSIEATITFPLPVHATLFALEARIGGRVLTARAARQSEARQNYEDALERGKAAVLHEEVLRGVHMLSVGHLAPGSEIEVRATWAMTLTHIDGRSRLRIPLTVGDIYGRSRLADSDDLISGGPLQRGKLTVACRGGAVSLIGGRLDEGRAEIPLNAPIDLEVTGWTPRELSGRMADGRGVALRISPYASRDAALAVTVLLDRSGSMNELCVGPRDLTKHQAALAAIERLADEVGAADMVDIWEFNTALNRVGSTRDMPLRQLAQRLAGPDGGTEIGRAIKGVMVEGAPRDILLVTDGKSHALDVQALARFGHRFLVVLVGADSLEAYVGHLAALTGGEIFVSTGADLPALLAGAVRSLRVPHLAPRFDLHEMRERRAGLEIVATWHTFHEDATESKPTREARAVAALAASMVLPTLDADAAARLAEAEGLVTHLTSLVLVDENGVAQEGIPATRKVALPRPDTGVAFAAAELAPRARREPVMLRSLPVPDFSAMDPREMEFERRAMERADQEAERRAEEERDLAELAARIDWDLAPARLQAGGLEGLAREIADAIRRLARGAVVVVAARKFGCEPVVLVVGLLARLASARSRAAARIARAILKDRPTAEIEREIAASLGRGG